MAIDQGYITEQDLRDKGKTAWVERQGCVSCLTCVRVCPYSHPDTAAHNLVRWAIGRSPAARRAMLRMDDVFYGKKTRSVDKIKR